MEDNPTTPRPPKALRITLLSWLEYLKKTFLFACVIAALVGASFLVTRGFSAQNYSDRLFTVGIVVTFIGVFIFITVGGTRRNMGFATLAKNPEEARKIMDHTHELIEKAEKRYDAGSQVWVTGVACLVLSVALYFILSAIGI
jgi:hypothetical protein